MKRLKWNEYYDLYCEYLKLGEPIDRNTIYKNVNLGNWVAAQRQSYKNIINNKKSKVHVLTKEEIEKLNNVNFEWNARESSAIKIWMTNYYVAKKYYEKHNNLNIKENYVDPETNLNLYIWLNNQKQKYKSKELNEEQIKLLEQIQINWKRKDNWEDNYIFLKKLIDEGQSLYPLYKLPKKNNINLSSWISTQIENYKNNKLSESKIKKLEEIGIIWDINEKRWEYMFSIAKEYYIKYCSFENNLIITKNDSKYEKLKVWLKHQRSYYKNKNNYKFSTERIRKLESIGMIWDEIDYQWFMNYNKLVKYYIEFSNIDLTIEIDNELYTWIRTQRKSYKNNKLSKEKINLLNKINFEWDASYKIKKSSFPEKTIYFYLSKIFKDTISNEREILDGKEFDIFIPSIKCAIEYDGYYFHKSKSVTEVIKNQFCENNEIKLIRIREEGLTPYNSNYVFSIIKSSGTTMKDILNKICHIINIDFNMLDYNIDRDKNKIIQLVSEHDNIFNEMYDECKKFYEEHLHLNVPVGYKTKKGRNLHDWLINIRTSYKLNNKNYLTNENIKKLTNIGMEWDSKSSFDYYYKLAKDFYIRNGHLKITRDYIVNGKNVGLWIKSIRKKYFQGKLTHEEINKLNEINMIWRIKKK